MTPDPLQTPAIQPNVQEGHALLVGTRTRSTIKAAQDTLCGDISLNTTPMPYGGWRASQRILDACVARHGKV